MYITSQTKIAQIIKANKESIDALAAVAAPLAKLRNPVLRKIMASRVTLAEAAKMAGCSIEVLVAALKPLGYTFQGLTESPASDSSLPSPDWLQQAEPGIIHHFDVRPIIATGGDPLKEIMAKFTQLQETHILCIINSFIPTPLINLLGKEKALTFTATKSPEEHHTFFLKLKSGDTPAASTSAQQLGDNVNMLDTEAFNQLLVAWPATHRNELDVRQLAMPLPMQTILAALETLPPQRALLVHHKRIPVFLLEELANKKFAIYIHRISDTEVTMLIIKQ